MISSFKNWAAFLASSRSFLGILTWNWSTILPVLGSSKRLKRLLMIRNELGTIPLDEKRKFMKLRLSGSEKEALQQQERKPSMSGVHTFGEDVNPQGSTNHSTEGSGDPELGKKNELLVNIEPNGERLPARNCRNHYRGRLSEMDFQSFPSAFQHRMGGPR